MAVAKQKNPGPYITEIEQLILHHFPASKFRITEIPGDDDDGSAIWTYSDGDHDDIRDLVSAREIEILVDHDIDIMTIPVPLEDWRD
jgi:hypothetical protein